MRTISCLIGTLLISSVGLAQPVRTFVSAVSGNDANPCTKTAPCRNFDTAVAAVAAGGEVVALDTGGYGPVTVTKSVAILAVPAVHAAIAPTSGTGIMIAAGATDAVRIQNVYLNGRGAAFGIYLYSAKALSVNDVVVSGLVNHGLVAIAGHVTVSGSTFRHNNDAGILLAGAGVRGQIADTLLHSNGNPSGVGFCGGLAVSAEAKATVTDTIAAFNFRGFQVFSANSELALERSAAVNGVVGLFASGGLMRVSNSTIVNNTLFGIEAQSQSLILSRLNNVVAGNAAAETFTGSFAAK